MKLKFRADPKNWFIFGVFMIFLFLLIDLIVVNAIAFLNNTSFTLNPLLAFSEGLIAPVMVFYIGTVIVVFSSLNSYFFEREKGIGFSSSPKKEKGYSRWASDKEFKKILKKVNPKSPTSDVAGIPLINNGKEIWVDDGEWHNLVIGSTASGKTESIVQPMVKTLAKAGESMIITDPKGEIYERNAEELREKGYEIILLNFRNPQMGNCWNPLTLPYSLYKSGNNDKATELLDDLAKNILYDETSKGQDPFWENTSADYFAGLSLALFEDAKEEEINLNTINLMTTIGEEKIGNTTYMKEYFSDKDKSSPAYVNVASTIMAPAETKGSILSVFKQKIKLFSSKENLSEMLSRSDFDMKDIGKKKTAVFIVIHDEKKTYHPLATIFIKQCYETLVDVAFENGGKLPFKTNFILDEFANMPPLKDADAMVTAARSRKIRFTFIIQNFAQLTEVYGKEKGDTIKGNCGNWIYLISSELSALEEISKMCGEVKSKKDDKTASTPLVTVSDLQRLPMYTMIILRTRENPFKTKMTPAWKMEKEGMWDKVYPKSDYPHREKNKVPVFDLKEYVDKKREEKINQMMSNSENKGPSMFDPSAMFSPKKTPFNPMMGKNPGLDVDEIVKRLDAKIAELEEEERLENEKNKQQELKDKKDIKEVIDFKDEKSEKDKKKDDFIDTKVSSDADITDDQFFDDFFYDDDE